MVLQQRPSSKAQVRFKAHIALAGSGLATKDLANWMLITRPCPKDLFWSKACKQATRQQHNRFDAAKMWRTIVSTTIADSGQLFSNCATELQTHFNKLHAAAQGELR
ncbi:TPA: hypothetical protein ACH3X3_001171 [Trebouxia sp. C0006]